MCTGGGMGSRSPMSGYGGMSASPMPWFGGMGGGGQMPGGNGYGTDGPKAMPPQFGGGQMMPPQFGGGQMNPQTQQLIAAMMGNKMAPTKPMAMPQQRGTPAQVSQIPGFGLMSSMIRGDGGY